MGKGSDAGSARYAYPPSAASAAATAAKAAAVAGAAGSGMSSDRDVSTSGSRFDVAPGAIQFLVDGRKYDMTAFAERHPGGTNALKDVIGLDATTIFFTTHPRHVWKQLHDPEFERKYLVPEPAAVQKQRRDLLGGYDFECEFMLECKAVVANHLARRVRKYGKHFDHGVALLWSAFWCLLPALAYCNMLSSGGSVASCVVVGVCFAIGTFNLMHPSMHGAITAIEPLKSCFDLSFTVLSGGCAPIWVSRHNICHHGHLNTAKDSDKHANPYLRLHPHQPKRWWYGYQHLYFPLLAAVNIGLNQFLHIDVMLNQPVEPGLWRRENHLKYWASLSVWLTLAYVIPVATLGLSTSTLGAIVLFQVAGSYVATYNIVINHLFEGAHTSTEAYGSSFAKMQAAGSANHSAGSMLGTFLTGGLNHQLEHHLFPSLAIHHFPLIAAEIETVCKKHKVPYHSMSFPALVLSAHKVLRTYGNCEPCAHLPGLGDYHSLMDGG
eukprot:SAG22_NODE_1238_length_5049_cov_42.930707_5_plen_494_part_00